MSELAIFNNLKPSLEILSEAIRITLEHPDYDNPYSPVIEAQN